MRTPLTRRLSLLTLVLLTCVLVPVARASASTTITENVTVPPEGSECTPLEYGATSVTLSGDCPDALARFSIWYTPKSSEQPYKLSFAKEVNSYSVTYTSPGWYQICVYSPNSVAISCTLTETYQ